ncbi:hypothetical protein I5J06_00580 [Pseudomonas aeruginosa]|uniref:hypothetical protein n=1 Tax=Pseudomonas aeruginosa TaxID=287 RepID=UPI001A1D243B|nr:hypothetical protein [Pseudomonas aeruginosa]MBG6882066.1 hypothetical protein [Pseudomonas aeruginosa]MBX6150567.1 hypothetical protein [Pseudomonas aeruginosa]MBX6172055.1 hypothetical protein [Pseudomonas aeruginosa]MDV7894733.1 hypothetical protein [Pseudomonas aeruginosa]HDZ3372121.1 hypothetical protein [Pseudomonas aeruginosa]
MTDINKLKELAVRALPFAPGEWFVENGIDQVRDCANDFVCETGEDDPIKASFIAAANPQAILKLIAEVEHLRKDAARYRWLRDSCTRQWDVMCRDIEIVINGDGAEDCEDLDGIIDAALEGATQ